MSHSAPHDEDPRTPAAEPGVSDSRAFGLRVGAFVFGVALLFTSLMRTIYLESAAVAAAYETRRLRDRVAVTRNENDVLRADIANLRNVKTVGVWAEEMGLAPVARDTVTVVRIDEDETVAADEGESAD